MTLLTQKQYAARKGVTPQYVNKLVRQGKIELTRGKINPREADAAIAAQRRAGRVLPASPNKLARKSDSPRRSKSNARKRRPASFRSRPGRPAMPPPAAPLEASSDPNPGSATARLTQSRARREHFMAEQARIEFERLTGKLLPAEDVQEAQRRQNANVRTRFRRLARSTAPLLAKLTQPAEIEEALGLEIDALLRELAADPLGATVDSSEPPTPEAPIPAADVQTAAQEGAAA